MQHTRKLVVLSLLLAVAIILSVFEMYIPRPFPWAKPGLANVMTLTVLYLFGWKDAIAMSLARVFLVSFLTGGFAGPAFVLSLVSATASAATMAALLGKSHISFGPIGISAAGAAVHILVQLGVAGVFFIGKVQIVYLLPLFMLPAFFTGIIVGSLGLLLLLRLEKRVALAHPIGRQGRDAIC